MFADEAINIETGDDDAVVEFDDADQVDNSDGLFIRADIADDEFGDDAQRT